MNFRFLTTLLLAFALIANSILPVFIASYAVQQSNQYANKDAMMICTGTSVKWISQSAFLDLGELRIVDAPDNTPSHLQEIGCSFKYIAEKYPIEALTFQISVKLLSFRAITQQLLQAPYTAFAYQPSQSRAPPSL